MIVAEDTVVTMTYTVKNESGNVLDANHERSPVIYRVGCRELPEGVEKEIIGLQAGDKRIFEVRPEQGYGKRKEDLVIRVRQSELPDDAGEPFIGKKYRRLNTQMKTEVYKVVGFLGKWIFLDANHPFSGITLQYEVAIVDVQPGQSID
jgi:FKBP-type peptidyl-prolyl cis-trans isomerase 2